MTPGEIRARVEALVAERRRESNDEVDALRVQIRHMWLLLKWADVLYPGWSAFN